MSSKYNISFKTLLPVIVAVIAVIIIEYYRITDSFPQYNRSLRDFDHLIAGIIVPYIFHTIENDSVNFSCIVYAAASFLWEFSEFIYRGYFQYDQFYYDLIGVAIIFLIYNYNEK